MDVKKWLFRWAWVLVTAFPLVAVAGGPERPAAQRRAELLRQAAKGPVALSRLAAALDDGNLVVRRTAVRLLAEMGPPARPVLERALRNSDFLVRRTALLALCTPLTPAAQPALSQALRDPHLLVRLTAVHLLVALQPRTEAVTELLNEARQDESQAVREVAAQALWPFFKETVSIRDRPDWDHEIQVAQTIPLPREGWRFQTDPQQDGHLRGWFDPAFDDSAWAPIHIEEAWEPQGFKYDGVAWYRGWFDLPDRPEHLAVEMRFGAVDECAWVWINGQYVGQHDLGPEGWDRPFTLDVTSALRWGQRNQITVRVYDSVQAGGIWKPVQLEVLQ